MTIHKIQTKAVLLEKKQIAIIKGGTDSSTTTTDIGGIDTDVM